MFGVEDHADGDIRPQSTRGTQSVEAPDVGAYQQDTTAEVHGVVQFFDANDADIETRHFAAEKIHAVEGDAGEGVKMPGDFGPGWARPRTLDR